MSLLGLRGNFNGQGFEIQNIYVNTSGNAGLFGGTNGATISNIGISGNITSIEKYAGAFVASGRSDLYACYNKANVNGYGYTGGIVGSNAASCKIYNCYNLGDIASQTGKAGGLAGRFSGEIINCFNLGKIRSNGNRSGGIVGQSGNYQLAITNCYNIGNIESGKSLAAGIISDAYAETIVNNCFNIGKIDAGTLETSVVKYSDAVGIGGTETNNCYNIGKLSSTRNSYTIGATTINNCYYSSKVAAEGENIEEGLVDIAEKTTEEFVELLNSYKDETGTYPADWKTWKVGDDGYPVFE